MKEYSFNIIIPSITIDNNLLNCLKKIQNLKYKIFFVTLVLDYKNSIKIKKYKYRIHIIETGNINMSLKRNIAAKKFKSIFIAFLDSDAYPNINWLKNANLYLKKNNNLILGGPNIPFPKQTYSELLCHYCKRSFFLNGHLNYRKYKSKEKYTNDWLESCNLIIKRNFFLKNKGMNKDIYIGEDREFFERIRKNIKDLKVLFSPKLYIFHKERDIFHFILQRFSFGMDIFSGINFFSGIKGFLATLPFFVVSLILTISIIDLNYYSKIYIFTVLFFIFNILVVFEIKKYLKSFLDIINVALLLNLSNFIYGLGGFASLLGIRKIIEKKIYRSSKKN